MSPFSVLLVAAIIVALIGAIIGAAYLYDEYQEWQAQQERAAAAEAAAEQRRRELIALRHQAEEANNRRRAQVSRPKPVQLKALSLYIEKPGRLGQPKTVSSGTWVNPTDRPKIRPVALIVVNDQSAVGKTIPFEFQLLGPHDTVVYRCNKVVKLKKGPNLIYSEQSEYRIRSNTQVGNWHLQLFVGSHLLHKEPVLISANPLGLVNQLALTDDMEISEEETRLWESVDLQISLEDLLG